MLDARCQVPSVVSNMSLNVLEDLVLAEKCTLLVARCKIAGARCERKEHIAS